MPGDLNLKKSWHPALAKNRRKVQSAEADELANRKSAAERQAEIDKIRELEELKALQTGKPSRIGWMYQDNKESSDAPLPIKLKSKKIGKQIAKKPIKKQSKIANDPMVKVTRTPKASRPGQVRDSK